MYNLYNSYGLHSGDKLLDYMKDLIQTKTGNKDYTFDQLYNDKGIKLVITTCCLNQEKEYYISHENHPDLAIAYAARMSMSIPFVFQAVNFNGDLFVDGGLLNNYPIWIFGRDNPDVLGLRLQQPDLLGVDRNINSFYEYALQILNYMFLEIEKTKIDECFWNQTVYIDTLGVSSSNFSIDREKKEALIESGYQAMNKKLALV